MNHQHGVRSDDYAVCTAHCHAGRTRCQRVDPTGAAFAQPRQRVVHGQTIEQVTADTVERGHHW